MIRSRDIGTEIARHTLVLALTLKESVVGQMVHFGRHEEEGTAVVTLLELLILLAVAGICGSIGQALTGYTRGGCLVAVALGFIGALLGRWLATQFGLPEIFNIQIGNNVFPVVWSIVGSAIFVAFLALISGGHRRPID